MKRGKLYLGMSLIMAGILLSACGQDSTDCRTTATAENSSGESGNNAAGDAEKNSSGEPWHGAHVPITIRQEDETIEPLEFLTAEMTYDEKNGTIFGDGARLSHVLSEIKEELPRAVLDDSFELQIPEDLEFCYMELYDADCERMEIVYAAREKEDGGSAPHDEQESTGTPAARLCTEKLMELDPGTYYAAISVIRYGEYIESEESNAYTIYEYAFRLDIPGAVPDRKLNKEAKELCSITFYQAGNPDYRLTFTPGGRLDRNRLTVLVTKALPEFGEGILHRFSIDWDEETSLYRAPEQDAAGVTASDDWDQIRFLDDGGIELFTPKAEPSGLYYPETMYFMPEAFLRPLNQADIMTLSKEELGILRNQFFAAYGRKFESPHLSEYFSEKPWYLPKVEAEEFSDQVFSDLWRRNLEFLREQERDHSDQQASECRKAYEALPDMIYRDLLSNDSEILVRLCADPESAEDRGIYYMVEGEISLPVALEPEEYEAVKKNGETVKIRINDITGETATLRDTDNTELGDCILADNYYFLSYNALTGRYELWQNSADTLFKPAYEGEIAVLKGAEEEWYGAFGLTPGLFRRISYDADTSAGAGANADTAEYTDYCGNMPVFDEKGYLKALYIFGD